MLNLENTRYVQSLISLGNSGATTSKESAPTSRQQNLTLVTDEITSSLKDRNSARQELGHLSRFTNEQVEQAKPEIFTHLDQIFNFQIPQDQISKDYNPEIAKEVEYELNDNLMFISQLAQEKDPSSIVSLQLEQICDERIQGFPYGENHTLDNQRNLEHDHVRYGEAVSDDEILKELPPEKWHERITVRHLNMLERIVDLIPFLKLPLPSIINTHHFTGKTLSFEDSNKPVPLLKFFENVSGTIEELTNKLPYLESELKQMSDIWSSLKDLVEEINRSGDNAYESVTRAEFEDRLQSHFAEFCMSISNFYEKFNSIGELSKASSVNSYQVKFLLEDLIQFFPNPDDINQFLTQN